MSTNTSLTSTQIILRHPGGTLRVAVPVDVALGELMPDFLEVAGQPDGDGWTLSPPDGDPYPGQVTLGELGLAAGDVLVLGEPADPRSPHTDSPERRRPETVAPVAPWQLAIDSPMSAGTAGALPVRLSPAARCRLAVHAAASAPNVVRPRVPYASGAPDPASFTRPADVSRWQRMRDAWAVSDYQHALDQIIVGPRLCRCVTIAVVSPKGGVGKSTVSALLGSLLAFLRRDRVVAVETNPDWGSLGRRLVPDHLIFIDDLLAGPLADGQLSPTNLDAQLGRGPDGLMVAPAPTDPRRAQRLDEAAYRTLFARLSELVGALVLDCGTGLEDPPARAALACADQLVLVCDDQPDTASIVTEAARWLRQTAPALVLVVNDVRRSSRIDVAALAREVAFARGLAVIARDDHAARSLHGSHFSWTHAPAGWQQSARELTALLAADWRRLQIAY